MVRQAFVFPGQGSQKPGMGHMVIEALPEISAEVFDSAREITGMDIRGLCLDADAEQLQRTDRTQPALYVMSWIIHRGLVEAGVRPAVVAGHSLGEYTALTAAGVLDFEQGLRLVRRRGELMHAVAETTPGSMAAVMGMDLERLERLCETLSDGTGDGSGAHSVEVANDNGAGQVVVAGTAPAVAALVDALAGEGEDVRAVPLKVGAPFHCSLMRPVEREFAADLEAARFQDPVIPVIANATAAPVSTGQQAREALTRQLAGRVRWRETMARLAADGIGSALEVGPGRVLSGLIARSQPGISAASTHDARRIAKALTAAADADAGADDDPGPAGAGR